MIAFKRVPFRFPLFVSDLYQPKILIHPYLGYSMHPTYTSAVLSAINHLGFETLNPMQVEMLQVCQKANQVLLFSPTGSGKTAAFLLPLLEKQIFHIVGTRAMIIVPSRELALQIEQVFKAMSTGYKVTVCYGGHKVKTELNNLKEAPSLLIGTPGRIAYHLEKGHINAEGISTLILDEYDKSLEFGFEKEISAIFKHIPHPDQLIMTSATKSLTTPDFVKIEKPVILDYSLDSRPSGLGINLLIAEDSDKLSLLQKLISNIQEGLTLVFCNHRDAVERISQLLHEEGISHDTYHGGYEQFQREKALIKFRNGSTRVLVTTDLASRGLDIEGVNNIIHYQMAGNENIFIHRNGRTARMENEGTVWILLTATEKVPDFIPDYAKEINLEENKKSPEQPYFSTLYFGAGKKDKISKTDIVGLLIQKGGLKKEEIGLINVLDYESFSAVPKEKIKKLVGILSKEKLKNKNIKIAISE
ncbi:MAG: DEAD/DEAH box helicase [Prolixibacteraceae bacterium]